MLNYFSVAMASCNKYLLAAFFFKIYNILINRSRVRSYISIEFFGETLLTYQYGQLSITSLILFRGKSYINILHSRQNNLLRIMSLNFLEDTEISLKKLFTTFFKVKTRLLLLK